MEKVLLCLAAVDGKDRSFVNNLAAILYRYLEKRGRLDRTGEEVTRQKAQVLKQVLAMENAEYLELVGRFADKLETGNGTGSADT